jgi:hypothetical protein
MSGYDKTCGFDSGCLKTWLHWNYRIYINDLKANVIVLVASMFVNLKLHTLNKIIFKKLLNMSLWKQIKLTLKGPPSTRPLTYK